MTVKGTVKWFNSRKGYGFINTDEKDIFVHYSAILVDEGEFRTLYEGDVVEFDIIEGDKGAQAESVKIIEAAPRKRRNKPRQ